MDALIRDIFERAARLVTLLASGRADALSGRFFTVADDVIGMAERAGREALGDTQALRLMVAGLELGGRNAHANRADTWVNGLR